MSRLLFGCCILALCLAACDRTTTTPSTPQANPAGSKYVAGDFIGGQTRRYRRHVSKNYQQRHATALVLNLHGVRHRRGRVPQRRDDAVALPAAHRALNINLTGHRDL